MSIFIWFDLEQAEYEPKETFSLGSIYLLSKSLVFRNERFQLVGTYLFQLSINLYILSQ